MTFQYETEEDYQADMDLQMDAACACELANDKYQQSVEELNKLAVILKKVKCPELKSKISDAMDDGADYAECSECSVGSYDLDNHCDKLAEIANQDK